MLRFEGENKKGNQMNGARLWFAIAAAGLVFVGVAIVGRNVNDSVKVLQVWTQGISKCRGSFFVVNVPELRLSVDEDVFVERPGSLAEQRKLLRNTVPDRQILRGWLSLALQAEKRSIGDYVNKLNVGNNPENPSGGSSDVGTAHVYVRDHLVLANRNISQEWTQFKLNGQSGAFSIYNGASVQQRGVGGFSRNLSLFLHLTKHLVRNNHIGKSEKDDDHSADRGNPLRTGQYAVLCCLIGGRSCLLDFSLPSACVVFAEILFWGSGAFCFWVSIGWEFGWRCWLTA